MSTSWGRPRPRRRKVHEFLSLILAIALIAIGVLLLSIDGLQVQP